MTAKNALLFCLAVFGIIFIGIDACLPMWGLGQLSGAMTLLGGLMLAAFLAIVLGIGFILKLVYLGGAAFAAMEGFRNLFLGGDFVIGIVFAVATFLLCALIPAVFLKKK